MRQSDIARFKYDPAFIRRRIDISPLRLPLRPEPTLCDSDATPFHGTYAAKEANQKSQISVSVIRPEWRREYAKESEYLFVDPSAGDGVFYDMLPKDRRMGVEIVPGRAEFHCSDYLKWRPPGKQEAIAVVGNPPFGYRAWLALAFVKHSAEFADYIGMILPMAFQSDGKGSPKFRVRGQNWWKRCICRPTRSSPTEDGRRRSTRCGRFGGAA